MPGKHGLEYKGSITVYGKGGAFPAELYVEHRSNGDRLLADIVGENEILPVFVNPSTRRLEPLPEKHSH